MKTLIIIDFQKDFISGSLAVPNAVGIGQNIVHLKIMEVFGLFIVYNIVKVLGFLIN